MKLTRLLATVAVMLPLFVGSAAALDVPPMPTAAPIVDQAQVLSVEQEQALAQKIATGQKETGNQVAVLTVASLDGESLEEYSLEVARSWGIGGEERDSGVLLFVAVEDRRVRIEVGYGLEGALPDIRANRIIQDRIAPSFREGQYYVGIDKGVDGILLAVQNERDPNLQSGGTASQQQRGGGVPWEFVAGAVLFVPTWLGAILGRTKSWWAGGVLGLAIAGILMAFVGLAIYSIAALVVLPIIGLLFDKAVSKNYRNRVGQGIAPSWWAGGTHLGGGGGNNGFGGFGGGDFGGGGSSGSW